MITQIFVEFENRKYKIFAYDFDKKKTVMRVRREVTSVESSTWAGSLTLAMSVVKERAA